MNATGKGRILRAVLALWVLVPVCMMFMATPSTASAQDAGRYLKAFIERLNEGTAKGDFDYAVGLQAEDGIRVHPSAGVLKGRKALRDFFAGVATRFSGAKETITWMVADDSHAAASITWESTDVKSGKHLKMPMAFIADFDSDGRIKWSQVWFDFGAAMKAAE